MTQKLILITALSLLTINTYAQKPINSSMKHSQETIQLIKNGSNASIQGPKDWFTGIVRIDPLFSAESPARTSGGSVTFEPGSRTHWHTHPFGQSLIVTSGKGYIQQWNRIKQEIQPGDVIQIPAGIKHWHGATQTTAMTHIAIQEQQKDGKNVEWMEPVSDEQYSSH